MALPPITNPKLIPFTGFPNGIDLSGEAPGNAGVLRTTFQDSITATGNSRATAVTLSSQMSRITSAVAGTGALLPTCLAGIIRLIFNNSGATIQLYASGYDTIDGNPGYIGIQVASGAVLMVRSFATGAWLSQVVGGGGSGGSYIAGYGISIVSNVISYTGQIVPVTFQLPASENLAAMAEVSIWSNAGVANVRNANITDTTRPSHGYVTQAVTSGAQATLNAVGPIVAGYSALTPGLPVWLSTTNGQIVSGATAPGNPSQLIGIAVSATQIVRFFNPVLGG